MTNIFGCEEPTNWLGGKHIRSGKKENESHKLIETSAFAHLVSSITVWTLLSSIHSGGKAEAAKPALMQTASPCGTHPGAGTDN